MELLPERDTLPVPQHVRFGRTSCTARPHASTLVCRGQQFISQRGPLLRSQKRRLCWLPSVKRRSSWQHQLCLRPPSTAAEAFTILFFHRSTSPHIGCLTAVRHPHSYMFFPSTAKRTSCADSICYATMAVQSKPPPKSYMHRQPSSHLCFVYGPAYVQQMACAFPAAGLVLASD